MINFKETEIIGFGSILGPLVYKFKPGLNLIKAENGEGKTTIFNAWYWGLTGETLKPKSSVNTWPHLAPADYLGTKVSNLFYVGQTKYEIIRCNNFHGKVEDSKGGNRLIIKENDKVLPLKGIKANQEKIERILGYSPNLLKNTLVFGQKLKRLIDESGTNKKEILEEAFDMAFIINAQDKAKLEKQKIVDELSPLEKDLLKMERVLDGKRELLSQALEWEKEANEVRETEINTINDSIKELKHNIETLSGLHKPDDIKELKRQIFLLEKDVTKSKPKVDEYYDIMKVVAKIETNIDYKSSSIKKLEEKLKKVTKAQTHIEKCPTCKQTLKGKSQKEVENHYKEEVDKINFEIAELKKGLTTEKEISKSKKEQLASLKEVVDSIKPLEDRINKLEREKDRSTNALENIKQHTERLNKLEERLIELQQTKLKKKSPMIKVQLRSIKTQIKPSMEMAKHLQKRAELIDWLIKDPLSNSGLKAFIFRDMIHRLNDRMLSYSKYFGFKVEFEVDMDSSRKDINAYIIKGSDNVVPYEDLSGGQQQSVAVIIAFALHDIVSVNDRASNVLIMDEIFEGLSRTNVEKVNEIINSKLGNISINLITHRNEFNPYNSRVVKIKYKNNFTSIDQGSN